MRKLLCLVLMLALCAVSLAEGVPAVQVNDRVFSTEEVQDYVNQTAVNLQLTTGSAVDLLFEDEAEFLEAAAEHFVTVAIVDEKLKELYLDRLSDEEEQSLKLAARQTYDEIWNMVADRLRESYPEVEQGEELVTQTMEAAGYSMDDLYEAARQELLQQKLMDFYCSDVTVTEEDARAYYQETSVQPDRAAYEGNVPLFEQEVLLVDGASAYIPEGYFYIKYILLEPDGELRERIEDAQTDLNVCQEETQAAYDNLAKTALEEGDTDAARERYERAEQAEADAQAELERATADAEEAFEPLMEIVLGAIADGADFEELIDDYSDQPAMNSVQDPGFPFHPDSLIWDEHLREAVSKLERYGECAGPVYAMGAVYIVCRMDDMVCGEYEPGQEELEQLRQDLLDQKRAERLDELVQGWRGDFDIELNLDGLVMP